MISFSIFKSATIEGMKRILKIQEFGTKTADEVAPFGVDSSPIENMTAIYSTTSNNSESIILGYINKNQLAEAGETRFFSLDSNGALKAFVWLKKDGKLQLNGDAFTAVRFAPLQAGLNVEVNLINAELAKIAISIGNLGGSYVPAPISLDISNSESPDVKLK